MKALIKSITLPEFFLALLTAVAIAGIIMGITHVILGHFHPTLAIA